MGCVRSKRVKKVGFELSDDNSLPGLKDARLPFLIDFDHGLLDQLKRIGAMNCTMIDLSMVNRLNSDSNAEMRARFMGDVINASAEKREQFLSALDETRQSHVTNYIRNNGQRPADSDDNWPALEDSRLMDVHFDRLVDLIDAECGLLDEMISAGLFNDKQRATVSDYELSGRSKVKELLFIMQRKSIAENKKFIDCLVKTKQLRVVSILDPVKTATNPPLSEVNRAKLDANYSALVELIDTRDSGLLRELQAADCLTYKQRVVIESGANELASTRRLLDLLSRGSQSDYEKFAECLGKTGQWHVVSVLLTDSAVAVSQITAHGMEVDKIESEVLEAFMELLRKSTADRGKKLLIHAASALGPDNDLLIMKATRSISLFIASRSLPGLMRLHELYSSIQLKNIVREIFSELLESQQNVVIDQLVWERLDYSRCMQYLAEASGLSLYPKLYQYQLDTNTTQPGCLSLFDKYPHELKEILLMKAAGQLFVSMKVRTTNAPAFTLVTLSAVCRYWWQTLTGRRSNAWRLRRFFKHLCRPFAFNPRLVTSVQVESKSASGLVAFEGKLYVVAMGSNTISVYDLANSSSFVPIEHIKVPGLLDPYDLVVCCSRRCLFVSDFDEHCIWRVNLVTESSVVNETTQSPFVPKLQYIPCNLSVRSERLLVTSYGGDALYIHHVDDEERSQRINLPGYMFARHAVETMRGTFVVAHGSKWADDTCSDHTTVSELSADGNVLLFYKGQTPFSNPFYITPVDGNFLVCDRYNRRILHLNTNLELTQLLLEDFYENPLTQHYDLVTGTLYVAYENSATVTVYNV